MKGPEDRRDEGIVDMTLSTVANGKLEEHFQERLREAADCLSDTMGLQPGRGNVVTAKIPMEVYLHKSLETGFFSVSARALPIVEPKPLPDVTGAYLRDGSFKVEHSPEQTNLVDLASRQRGEE